MRCSVDSTFFVIQLQEKLLRLQEELNSREQQLAKGTAEHTETQEALIAERNRFAKKAAEAQKKAKELQSQLHRDGEEVTRLFEENLLLKHEENKLKLEVW